MCAPALGCSFFHGVVEKWPFSLPCHGKARGFDSRLHRHLLASSANGRRLRSQRGDVGSTPAEATKLSSRKLTVDKRSEAALI